MTSSSADLRVVDPYLVNAFSSAVTFDISHKSGQPNGRQTGEGEEVSMLTSPSKEWEVDVRQQVSTQQWLNSYGLRKSRLKMDQILPLIGFRHQDDVDPSLKQPVGSRYGQGLFQQISGANGKTFNLACDRETLLQLKKRLSQALALYRRRLDWLTSESRRIFGVVEEKSVTVVMDVRNMSPDQFDQYRTALQRVLREQFYNVTKFNIIRAAEDMQLYSPECIPLSVDTLERAVQWVWGLDRLAPVSSTDCAEAVLRAMLDPHNEAVYLFTEGTSVDCCRELLLDKVNSVERKIPVHVVSFNCSSSSTIKFLRNLTTITGGRFHAYAVVMEMDSYEPAPNDPETCKANVLLRRKTYGGIPPGAGVRPDVTLLFDEMEEARNNLKQVETLIDHTPEPTHTLKDKVKEEKAEATEKDEQYMSSKQWLAVYGIEARKLNLYDVLAGACFKHQDGVVEVMEKPPNDDQADAVGQDKLINARYCESFPVVRWKDGRVVHVQVTPDVHRNYEQRMQVVLSSIQQRLDWLRQGSRALFGTVVEEEIYILIDTSASMQHNFHFVKERLFVLMQEQLRHKSKFNLIAFNSKVMCWRERLTEVSEQSLQSAWKWVQDLTCWGSTNTHSAIQTALSDTRAEAIYLLSDGRPDQPAKSIIAQVRMAKRVPIHTISFNCSDSEANQFLYDLAQTTGGRYHIFADRGNPVGQSEAWQSEDIQLLTEEMGRGCDYLDLLADLRNQCSSLSWKKEVEDLQKGSKGHPQPSTPGRVSAVPPLDPQQLYRSASSLLRPSSAPPKSPLLTPAPPGRPASAAVRRPPRSRGAAKRPQSAKLSHRGRKLVAGHTRTSLMRTLSSSGNFNPDEWLLPETASLFEQQSDKQRQLAQMLAKLGLAPTIKDSQNETDLEVKHRKRRQKLAKSFESSSKSWLKKNGLVAKRLTILDALAPTLVPHRSTYIPVLDKRVMARVFDEVMPIAHVSGGHRSKIHLVNPNGVNLPQYEAQLEKALARYTRRLNTIVWNALPENVKEEFDSKDPVPFCDHRGKFLQVLSEEGWPVAEVDIAALEKEIEKGNKFLQQSRDLRRAAAEACDGDDAASEVSDGGRVHQSMSNAEPTNQSVDEVLEVDGDQIITAPTTLRVGSSSIDNHTPRPPDISTPRSQENHTPRPPDDQTPRSAGSRTPRRSVAKRSHNLSRTTAPAAVSTPRSMDGKRRGRTNNSGSRSVDSGVKASAGSGKGRMVISTLRGTRVIARNDVDGLYYPGKVLKCPSVRHATVEFTDGQREVLTRFILPVGGAVACPPLSVGDYALVQVMNLDQASECYVPAIVQFTPQRRQGQGHFYTAMLYNGQKVTTRRTHLVKISKERFELSARYIAAVQEEDRHMVDVKVYVSEKQKSSSEDRQKSERHRSRSSSSSHDSRSRSRSPSRSRSRSPESPARPRSPTPGVGLRDSPSPPRSKSYSPVSPRRQEMKILGKRDEDRLQNSRRSIESRSRSRSKSTSPSRRDHSKQGSRSPSRSRSRSRSRSPSSSPDRKSKRKARRRSRSGSGSRSGSQGSLEVSVNVEIPEDTSLRRESRSSSRSSRSRSRITPATDRKKELKRLQKQLEKQQKKQARERKKLKRERKKVYRQTQLLEKILDEKREKEEQEAEKEAEPEEEEAPIVTPRLLQLRRTMPELQRAEEVLARFTDDGWYYRGTVQQNMGDLSYIVEDATGHIERIWREDIISDYDDNAPPLQEDDRVIARHPSHSGSYAPGSVLAVDDVLQTATVQFYDGQEGAVPRADVYRLPRDKYSHDVVHIQQRQRSMLGKSVVARDDGSGQYFPGQIVELEEGGQHYVIRWSDGSLTKQLPVHIFSAVTRRPRLLVGDRVLAMASPDQVVFLPGQIIAAQDGQLVIRFCDGQVRDDVSPFFCYWLSQGYHEEASYFWKISQPDFGKRHMSQA